MRRRQAPRRGGAGRPEAGAAARGPERVPGRAPVAGRTPPLPERAAAPAERGPAAPLRSLQGVCSENRKRSRAGAGGGGRERRRDSGPGLRARGRSRGGRRRLAWDCHGEADWREGETAQPTLTSPRGFSSPSRSASWFLGCFLPSGGRWLHTPPLCPPPPLCRLFLLFIFSSLPFFFNCCSYVPRKGSIVHRDTSPPHSCFLLNLAAAPLGADLVTSLLPGRTKSVEGERVQLLLLCVKCRDSSGTRCTTEVLTFVIGNLMIELRLLLVFFGDCGDLIPRGEKCQNSVK